MTWEIFQDASVVETGPLNGTVGTEMDDGMRFQIRLLDRRKLRTFELFWSGSELKGMIIDHSMTPNGERGTFLTSVRVKSVTPVVNLQEGISRLRFNYAKEKRRTRVLQQNHFLDCIEVQRVAHSQLKGPKYFVNWVKDRHVMGKCYRYLLVYAELKRSVKETPENSWKPD